MIEKSTGNVRNTMNRLLGPRWIFPIYWIVFLLATVMLHPASTLDRRTVALIILFCGVYFLAATVATANTQTLKQRALKPSVPPVGEIPILNSRIIVLSSLIGAVANLVAALLALRNNQFSLAHLFSLEDLAESANTLAVERYAGESGGFIVFVLLAVGYIAALVAPFVGLTSINHKIFWMVLPVLTSLAYAAVSSARLGFLVSVALTAGGIISCSIVRRRNAPKIKAKSLVSVIIVAAILGSLFTGIGVLRTGRIDSVAVHATMDKWVSYTVGTVGAFSTWNREFGNGGDTQLGYGTASIAGMEYLTGQSREETRAYGEFAVIDDSGTTTNVYTVFRGLMLDFGIAGTMIFFVFAGFTFGRLFLGAVRGSVVAACVLGYAYASILFSGWMAITTFTNLLVVVVAAPVILILSKRLGERDRIPLAVE